MICQAALGFRRAKPKTFAGEVRQLVEKAVSIVMGSGVRWEGQMEARSRSIPGVHKTLAAAVALAMLALGWPDHAAAQHITEFLGPDEQ